MMKPFIKLSFLFAIALQSTALLANFQQTSKNASKNYLDIEMLDFTRKGIFVHSNRGHAFPIPGIQYDSNGYFFEEPINDLIPQSARVIAACNSCGHQYENRFPQPCENCHQNLGFTIIDIDDGY